MSNFEDIQDFFIAGFVILIISIILTLAWMSTYVRNLPLIATTVVVLQQESRPNSSSNSQNTQTDTEDMNPTQTETEDIPQQDETVEEVLESVNSDNNESSNDKQETNCNLLLSESRPLIGNIKFTDNTINETNVKDEAISCIGPCNINENELQSVKDEEDKAKKDSINEEPSVRKRYTTISASHVKNRIKNENTILEEGKKENTDGKKESKDEEFPPGFIRIKLKFLDDSQRLVRGQLSQLVGNFKRANFQIELSTNCAVRLIFNGQLLSRDSSTLGQYGLFDNCVVHCYVGQPQSQPTNDATTTNTHHETDDIDLSEILSPLLLIVMAFLWYLRYEYSHIFNTSATFILICLTALLLISQYALTITFNISLGFNNSTNDGNPPQSHNDSSLTESQNSERNIEEIGPNYNSTTSSQPTQNIEEEDNISSTEVNDTCVGDLGKMECKDAGSNSIVFNLPANAQSVSPLESTLINSGTVIA